MRVLFFLPSSVKCNACPVPSFYEAWLTHRYELRQPASGLFGLAREYFLLRRIAEISGIDPSSDALENAEFNAIKEEFELEEMRFLRPQVRMRRHEAHTGHEPGARRPH